MASHLVTVDRLLPGQMVSMPECDVPLSYVTAISKPFMGMRAIDLADPDTGDLRPAQMRLGINRVLRLHDDTVDHHRYTNVSAAPLTVRLGKWEHTIRPGESLHYTGRAQPTLFGPQEWRHETESHPFDHG